MHSRPHNLSSLHFQIFTYDFISDEEIQPFVIFIDAAMEVQREWLFPFVVGSAEGEFELILEWCAQDLEGIGEEHA